MAAWRCFAASEIGRWDYWPGKIPDWGLISTDGGEEGRHVSLSYACMKSLLSVRMQAFWWDLIRYVLKCLTPEAIVRASISQDICSQFACDPRNVALKSPTKRSVVVTIHTWSSGLGSVIVRAVAKGLWGIAECSMDRLFGFAEEPHLTHGVALRTMMRPATRCALAC